jgi:flagellar hook-length control protein FliK
MTLRVEPEAIGPLRIVAEVRGEHVRVELMGVGELARDLLRSALPDLRRELAAAGMQAQLDLATDDRDFGRDSSGGSLGDRTKADGRQNDARDGVHVHEAEPATSWTPTAGGRLDVLA